MGAKPSAAPRETMTLLQAALLSIFPALLILAALSDATSYTIPNRISLLLLAAFFPAALALGRPMGEIGVDVAVGAIALVAAMAMFAAGWIGGGDAKLFAVASLWLGWSAAPVFVMATALAGGGLALMLLNVRAAWLRPYFSAAPALAGAAGGARRRGALRRGHRHRRSGRLSPMRLGSILPWKFLTAASRRLARR